jgi:hypothetical protein
MFGIEFRLLKIDKETMLEHFEAEYIFVSDQEVGDDQGSGFLKLKRGDESSKIEDEDA